MTDRSYNVRGRVYMLPYRMCFGSVSSLVSVSYCGVVSFDRLPCFRGTRTRVVAIVIHSAQRGA